MQNSKLTLHWSSMWISLSVCPTCASLHPHYNDVIMGAIASQITSLTIVYSIVYSDADQRKHQSSASLAFVRGIPRTNGQLRGKCFHLMTSSCILNISDAFSRDRQVWFAPNHVNKLIEVWWCIYVSIKCVIGNVMAQRLPCARPLPKQWRLIIKRRTIRKN